MSSQKENTTRKIYKEIITPHRLTVAILIRTFCKYRDSDEFKGLKEDPINCKYRRDFALLTLRLVQSHDLPLAVLQNLISNNNYKLPPIVIDTFNETLSGLYTSGSGTLLDILDSLSRIITFNDNTIADGNKCIFGRNSVIGYYLRRLIVHFEKLTFSEVTRVYLAYQRYYQEGQEKVGGDLGEVDEWATDRDQWSKRQAELFIATQAALLMNNERKALSPAEMQKRICTLLKSNPNIAEAHFLLYLNNLRVKEFCGAMDSLYHCFDKCFVADGKNDNKNQGYRFAALNLAILHYYFGNFEEALASLKDAIKISQEANDNVCLQHALTWLSTLTNSNKDKLIVHCVTKSVELGLTYTTSLGLQTIGQHGSSMEPAFIFKTLAQSDIINSSNGHHDLVSNSYAIKSSLWQFYGKSEMSLFWSQLLLNLKIYSQSPKKSYYGEGFCLSVCNVANHLCLDGEYLIVFSILGFIKNLFPNQPHSHIWMLCENLFIFQRAMYHEKWVDAEAAAQKMMVIDKWEGYLRLTELYLHKEDYSEANRCIDALFKHYESETKSKLTSLYFIRASILLAEVQFASCSSEATPNGILTNLNNCLSQTKKLHLDYQTAYINLLIANIQLALGLTAQAMKLLDRYLLQILTHGGGYDRARGMLLMVKCMVADSSKFTPEKREVVLLEAAELLEIVKRDFEQVEAYSRVKDVLFLQGNLYNLLNMKSEKNKCAIEFRKLDEEKRSKNLNTLHRFI